MSIRKEMNDWYCYWYVDSFGFRFILFLTYYSAECQAKSISNSCFRYAPDFSGYVLSVHASRFISLLHGKRLQEADILSYKGLVHVVVYHLKRGGIPCYM